MGEVLKYSQISLISECSLKPVIICNCDSEILKNTVSLNTVIAQKLSLIPLKSRTRKLEQCFIETLRDFNDNVIIKDFDVLFNPDYKIDVIAMMVSAYKKKSFSAIWPGRFEEGKLIYAEEGYSDYKIYDIGNYDITCVI